jgi:hypothetical protein
MSNPGKLKLRLTDVNGKAIKEAVDVFLRHLTRGTELRVRLKGGTAATITNLLTQPDGVYSVTVDPPSYRPVAQFISIRSTGVTPLHITFPVDPKKVKSLIAPPYSGLSEDARRVLDVSDAVLLFEGKSGEVLYDAMDDTRRAGLLNIFAKANATTFASGKNVLAYVKQLTELRGDRFHAVVARELREEVKHAVTAGLFHAASGVLHHPPEGCQPDGSFKTEDHYGNLQVTFFVKGEEWHADIDIDNAAGLEHSFQVVGNTVRNQPTHPYDIHEILTHHQRLDVGYSLIV